MERPQPFSAENAKKEILLKLVEGKLEFTDHCLYERMPQRNVAVDDIIFVLETGKITRQPE